MDVRELTTEAERTAAIPILGQLWPDTDPDEIRSWTEDDEYRLFGRFDGDALVGVAGVRLEEILHHARHAWIADLVVDEPRRGAGHGTALLEFVEEWAAARGCDYVALASPLEKEGVHEYYEDRAYERWGYVFETECGGR